MSSIAYVGTRLKAILEEDAKRLARETGGIKREQKFSGADLVQTLVFGWQGQPEASWEQLASLAQEREVSESESAIHKRLTPECARSLLGEGSKKRPSAQYSRSNLEPMYQLVSTYPICKKRTVSS